MGELMSAAISFLDRKEQADADEAGTVLEEALRTAVVDAMEAVHPTYVIGALECIKLELQVTLFNQLEEEE